MAHIIKKFVKRKIGETEHVVDETVGNVVRTGRHLVDDVVDTGSDVVEGAMRLTGADKVVRAVSKSFRGEQYGRKAKRSKKKR